MAIDVSVFRLISGERERPSLYYNLYVSNLEDRFLQYTVEYWHRATFNEVHVTVGRFRDVEGTYSPQSGVFVATHRFALLPRETTVLTLRFAGVEPQPIDLGGYVRLRIPRVKPNDAQHGLRLVSQADGPVKVMLHAETVTDVALATSERGGFTDMNGYAVGRYGSVGALSNLRTAVGLALASGRAVNEILPDGNFVIGKESLEKVSRIAAADPSPARKGATEDVADENRARALVELLSELSPDGETIQEVNQLLKGTGVGVQIGVSKPGSREKP